VATQTLSSPIFYGGIYLEVFRERKKMDFAMVRKGERVIGHLEFSSGLLGNSMWKLENEERK